MTAWIVRHGVNGEYEEWALTNGRAAIGFDAVGDLTHVASREAVRQAVNAAYPADPPGRQMVFTNQLWAIRDGIRPGDLVVLPLKAISRKLALGVCTGGYEYLPQEGHHRRHTVKVDWKTQEVSRSGIKQDLLNTINGAMTIFQAKRNGAEERLRAVLATGVDPGGPEESLDPGTQTQVEDDVIDPTPTITLGAIRDRVTTFLVENVREHRLTELIAAILRTEGYVCEVSPPGPDHGVDILAGRGPLGLDSPTLIVEVKSEPGPIASPVVRGLQGAMSQHRADQGLLVAWGGLNGPATREVRTDRLTLRVWDADEIVNRLFAAYDRLPDDVRAQIPLKRTWVLDEEAG